MISRECAEKCSDAASVQDWPQYPSDHGVSSRKTGRRYSVIILTNRLPLASLPAAFGVDALTGLTSREAREMEHLDLQGNGAFRFWTWMGVKMVSDLFVYAEGDRSRQQAGSRIKNLI